MNEATLKFINDINKKLKKPLVTTAATMPDVFRIKTGNPAFDYVATGGIAVNRMIEFYGAEASTKTYHCQLAMREFQNTDWNTRTQGAIEGIVSYKEKKVKMEDGSEYVLFVPDKIESKVRKPRLKNVIIIDIEGTQDPVWNEQLGLDNKRLIRVVPDTTEQGIDLADAFLRDEDTCLVVIDSIHAGRAQAEIDKPMDEQTMGLQARTWNRAFAKFQNALNANPEKDATLMFINKEYQKIGVMFGDPNALAGGGGAKFAKSQAFKFTAYKELKGELNGVKDTVLGRNIKVENKKNKTGRPYRTAEFFFCLADNEEEGLKYGDIDTALAVSELGLIHGIIQKSGTTYSFGRLKARGRDGLTRELRSKPHLMDSIMEKLY